MLGRQALTWLQGPVLLQTAHQTGTEHSGDQSSLGPSSGTLQNRRAHKLTPPRGRDQNPCLPKTPQRDPEQILNPTGPSGAPRNTFGSEASLPDTGETEVPNSAPWSLRISTLWQPHLPPSASSDTDHPCAPGPSHRVSSPCFSRAGATACTAPGLRPFSNPVKATGPAAEALPVQGGLGHSETLLTQVRAVGTTAGEFFLGHPGAGGFLLRTEPAVLPGLAWDSQP